MTVRELGVDQNESKMKVYVCMSQWRDKVVLHQQVFTDAPAAVAFCNAENESNKDNLGFVRCDFTAMQVDDRAIITVDPH